MEPWRESEALRRGEVIGGLIPPAVHVSAADLPRQPDDVLSPEYLVLFERGELPFWRPGVFDVLQAVGWRWVILIPALIAVIGIPLGVARSPALSLVGHMLKLWLLGIGVVITIILGAAKRGVSARKDAFCIHCGYTIEGLGESGRCPECGRSFILSAANEYRKDPHFFMVRVRALSAHPKSAAFAAGEGPTPDDGTRELTSFMPTPTPITRI